LIDDLAGSGDARGFRGHVAALAHGRLTTGGLKLVGGAAVAIVACGPVDGGDTVALLRDAALVALAANLGNLFDRAPGRTLKISVLCFAALAALASGRDALSGTAAVIGASLALLVDDLHERLMLGDAGANVLGGVLGLGVVLACSGAVRTGVLVAVALLNVTSEAVSFSRVIDAIRPFRAIDRWGRYGER
jgi:UDP-GlcNAc:undecaprenyl-phosphate GlcNAc-1-phosphate transferase